MINCNEGYANKVIKTFAVTFKYAVKKRERERERERERGGGGAYKTSFNLPTTHPSISNNMRLCIHVAEMILVSCL